MWLPAAGAATPMINVVYPDGQAWTVPNEAGACSAVEGSTDWTDLTCTIQPRPIVRLAGNRRAVVEAVAASNPANRAADERRAATW